jgi:hypothetical protein
MFKEITMQITLREPWALSRAKIGDVFVPLTKEQIDGLVLSALKALTPANQEERQTHEHQTAGS